MLHGSSIHQERVASSEIVTTWVENGRCPYIQEVKTIVHPGEVGVAATGRGWEQLDGSAALRFALSAPCNACLCRPLRPVWVGRGPTGSCLKLAFVHAFLAIYALSNTGLGTRRGMFQPGCAVFTVLLT